jgi:HK97 gp10 family phage protein
MANRALITKGGLLKLEGLGEIISKMEKIIENTSGGAAGKKLKKVYVSAASVISAQARRNIANLEVSPDLRAALIASVVTNEGPESKPNAISKVSQPAAIRKLGDAPNPYWWEYGTVPRATGKGANRGQIKPQPFFRPAIEQARGKAIEVLTDGLKKLIEP